MHIYYMFFSKPLTFTHPSFASHIHYRLFKQEKTINYHLVTCHYYATI